MNKLLSYCRLALLACASLASCSSPPKVLFAVAATDPALGATAKAQIHRGKEAVSVESGTELEDGDVVEIPPSYAGVGLTWFRGIATVHGRSKAPTTLKIGEDTLEQSSGTVFHQAESGRVLAPGLAIDSRNASFLLASEESATTIVVFDGRVEVSPTREVPWKPFAIEARQERRVWHDGRLSPNRPLTPDELNRWIGLENQLLTRAGAESRMVPSVVNLPTSEARGMVSAAAFQPTRAFTREGEFDLGTIAKQSPASGRHAELHGTVTFFERTSDIRVPDLTGKSFGAAQKELQELGLVGRQAGSSITGLQKAYMIHTQDPPSGALAPKGGAVLLTTEAFSVHVPYIEDMSLAAARMELAKLGLSMNVRDFEATLEPALVDSVAEQYTPASGLVPPNSTIEIRRFVQGFLVPSLEGMRLADAQAALLSVGLPAGIVGYVNSDTVPTGVVMTQGIPANTAYHRAEPIGLVVSIGPPIKP